MTEPREPETTPDEGESTQPIAPQPGSAAWYPVDPRPKAPEPEAPQEAPEPTVDESVGQETVAEAPVGAEPVAEDRRADVPAESHAPDAIVSGEPVAERPIAAEPVPEAPTIEEPQAAHSEQTVDATASEPTRTLFGDAEPTVATDGRAEETVAFESEPIAAESTSVLPRATVVEATPPGVGPTESIFRQPSPTSGPEFEPTRVEQLSDEEQKLAAERAARREARTTALAATAPVPLVAPDPVIVHKRTNDKFWGSVGLFLLRLVLAAILAVRGLNLLTDIPAAQAMFAKTIIPSPGIMAIVTGVAALLIALSLILGLLTRLAGLGIALIGAGALVFVYWGNWSPFIAGRPGFLGDYELLLTAVGVLLLCIGAGGWSLDRSIRSGRERNKAERAAEEA